MKTYLNSLVIADNLVIESFYTKVIITFLKNMVEEGLEVPKKLLTNPMVELTMALKP